MLNYIKSEFYRVFHSKDIYVMTGICCGLIILMNSVLAISEQNLPNFPYANTRFSFGMLISQVQIVFTVAVLVATLIFGDEYKHRTLKNTISFGISRTQIFCGKYIVSLVVAVVCFIIIMVCYVASAYILLENSGNEILRQLLLALAASIPSAVLSLTLGIALLFVLDNSINAALIWAAIMVFIPLVLNLMGARIDICYEIGNWLPWTMFSRGTVNQSVYLSIWDTFEGMVRCVVVGVVGSIAFFLFGLKAFYTKEIK